MGWLARLCCVWLAVVPLAAQSFDEVPLPAEPEGAVLDDGRVFALEPERLAKLEERLARLRQETGFEVKVAIFDTLIGTTLRDQTARLQGGWIGPAKGVVLVFEADSGRFEVGWEAPRELNLEGEPSIPVIPEEHLEPHEMIEVLGRLREAGVGKDDPADRVVGVVERFASELDKVQARRANPNAKRNLRVVFLGIGLLAGVALMSLLAAAWIRRADRREGEALVFPKVSVGMRLGAPFGGGKIGSRRFGGMPDRE